MRARYEDDGLTNAMRFQEESADRRGSRRAFVIAIASTIVAVVLGTGLLLGLYGPLKGIAAGPQAKDTAPSAGTPLIVAVARTPGGPGEWSTYAAVFAQLQRDLDRPVLVRYLLDRTSVVDLVGSGKVDLAMVTVNMYVNITNSSDATLVAAPIVDSEKNSSYVLVVSGDSDYKDLDDVRHARLLLPVASVATHSFATWLFRGDPSAMSEHFSEVVTGGSQENNLRALAAGETDATCVNRTDLAGWEPETFRVIAESPEFGMPPIVARPGLDDATVSAVQRSLLSAVKRGILETRAGVDGFFIPSDSDYDFVRTLVRMSSATTATEGVGSK